MRSAPPLTRPGHHTTSTFDDRGSLPIGQLINKLVGGSRLAHRPLQSLDHHVQLSSLLLERTTPGTTAVRENGASNRSDCLHGRPKLARFRTPCRRPYASAAGF